MWIELLHIVRNLVRSAWDALIVSNESLLERQCASFFLWQLNSNIYFWITNYNWYWIVLIDIDKDKNFLNNNYIMFSTPLIYIWVHTGWFKFDHSSWISLIINSSFKIMSFPKKNIQIKNLQYRVIQTIRLLKVFLTGYMDRGSNLRCF